MSFIIIFLVLVLIVYIISFNNRDKSQDYKIQNHRLHVDLSVEENIRIDLITDIDVGIEDIKKKYSDPILIKKEISKFLVDIENIWLANMNKVATKHNIPMYKVENIINECMDKAYKKYYT